jgi:Fic family protein
MSNIQTAIALKKEPDLLRPLDTEQESRIWQKFRFDWNYHSNHIEGNSLTFGETKSLLLHNITAQGKPLKDHFEITGHNEAINVLVDVARGDEIITESFIRSLHVLILKERYQSKAETAEGIVTSKWIEVGQYKTAANHVRTATGEIFRFAEPNEVPARMHALCTNLNGLKQLSDEQAIFEVAKLHYEFICIHPFDDGNGRMARLLMNLLLIKNGFPPAIIRTEDKANYFSALRQADGGQLGVFVEYIANCVTASLKVMLAGARGESIDDSNFQDQQIKMLGKLLENKVGRTNVVRNKEILQNLFISSFKPLAHELDRAAQLFKPMFNKLTTGAYLNRGASGSSIEEHLANLGSNISDDSSHFMFQASFSGLIYKGFDEFSSLIQLEVNLRATSFEIHCNFEKEHFLKGYDEQLTDEEIASLVVSLKRFQIAAIESATGVKANL